MIHEDNKLQHIIYIYMHAVNFSTNKLKIISTLEYEYMIVMKRLNHTHMYIYIYIHLQVVPLSTISPILPKLAQGHQNVRQPKSSNEMKLNYCMISLISRYIGGN